jgi:hypothetical protein
MALRALGAVVDVEEFEGLEDRVFFAGGTAAGLAVGRHCRTLDYAEGIAMGLFEDFRGDRAMRKFETAFGASQHPTGHVSASGPWVVGMMTAVGERTRRAGKII